MKIAVVIPVHGGKKRLELAKRVILYYETMRVNGMQIDVWPVLDDDAEQLTEPFTWGNHRTIGAKFNNGIGMTWRDQDTYDGVMIVGSDDLISPAVFQQILCDAPVYQELRGIHFFDAYSGAMKFDANFLVGPGKYFSREFLNRCDWRPYDDNADKNVDKGPNRFIESGERRALMAGENDPLCISVEVADNMTSWVQKTRNAFNILSVSECFEKMDGEWPEHWRM